MKIPKIQYEIYYNDYGLRSVDKIGYRRVEKDTYESTTDNEAITFFSNEKYKYKTTEETSQKYKLDVISISYSDYLHGSLDELEIQVSDPTQKWIRNWKPEQNDTISGEIYLDNTILSLQEFYIDEISYTVYPNIITIRGLSGSIPKDGQLRKRRYQKYKETTLQSIISGVAQRNNLVMQWNGDDVDVLSMNQGGRSDLKFISDLAKKYGFYTKIFTKVKKKKGQREKTKYLIFQDLTSGQLSVSWEGEQVSVSSGTGQRYITITDDDIVSSANFHLESVYEDRKDLRKYSPYDAKLDKFVAYNEKKQGVNAGTSRDRWSDGPIKNNARDAALNAILEETKGDLMLAARPDIVAGTIVYFDSKTVFKGTYLVWEVTHTIQSNSGWTTKISNMKRLSSADLPKPPKYYSTPKRAQSSHYFGHTVIGLENQYVDKTQMKKSTPIVPTKKNF
jgi:phage protein D